MCIDYGKANSVTKTDSFPVPRVDNCICNIGTAKVMPVGMKNSSATFQRLMNMIITGLDKWKSNIDVSIIYSEEWDQQSKTVREFFERLNEAKLKY